MGWVLSISSFGTTEQNDHNGNWLSAKRRLTQKHNWTAKEHHPKDPRASGGPMRNACSLLSGWGTSGTQGTTLRDIPQQELFDWTSSQSNKVHKTRKVISTSASHNALKQCDALQSEGHGLVWPSSAGLVAGLDHLGGLFQQEPFYDSVISRSGKSRRKHLWLQLCLHCWCSLHPAFAAVTSSSQQHSITHFTIPSTSDSNFQVSVITTAEKLNPTEWENTSEVPLKETVTELVL